MTDPKVTVIEPKLTVIDSKVTVIDPKLTVIDSKVTVIDSKLTVLDPKPIWLLPVCLLSNAGFTRRVSSNNMSSVCLPLVVDKLCLFFLALTQPLLLGQSSQPSVALRQVWLQPLLLAQCRFKTGVFSGGLCTKNTKWRKHCPLTRLCSYT